MSAQEAGGRSGLGWAILVAALAVPGFLFYNWSSRLKAEHDRTLSAKARGRLPDGGVFQTPPAAEARLVNPIAPSTTAVGGAAPAGMKPPMAAAPSPMATASAASGSAKPSSASAATTAPSAAPMAASGAMTLAGVKPSGVVTSTAAAVALPRDPLISPMDIVAIREAAEEEDRRRRMLERKPDVVKKRVVKKVERKIDDDVELEGIVTTPDGRPLAIVNNETLGAGSAFTLAGHPGQVRIVSISADTVVFIYKNKKFKKVVTTE